MVNKENIRKAIAVMERVKVYEETHGRKFLNMRYFQANPSNLSESGVKKQEKQLHKPGCGTVCCLAGWMAVSPEFQDQITPNEYGAPKFKKSSLRDFSPSGVIAELFGIPHDYAYGLIHPANEYGYTKVWNVFEQEVDEITPDQVIEKLKELLI